MVLAAVNASPPAARAEETARIHFLHAMKSKQEGDLLEAERLLQRAINLEPQNPDLYFELGNLHIERDRLESARLELGQAVMIAPSHLAAHFNLGLVNRGLGRMSEARDEFRRVLELDPRNTRARLQIGYTYQAEGFTEDARQAFETAGEMDASNPEPQRALEDLEQFENELAIHSSQEAAQAAFRNQGLLSQLRRGDPDAYSLDQKRNT